jgi:pyridoxal biosynthesis lyase PdxS
VFDSGTMRVMAKARIGHDVEAVRHLSTITGEVRRCEGATSAPAGAAPRTAGERGRAFAAPANR